MYTIKKLIGKVHGVTVTEANLAYRGSLTLDEDLIRAAGMQPYQEVLVVNNNNGERLETYLIAGAKGSGVCCLNGAAAHKGREGDVLIVMAWAYMEPGEGENFIPKRVFIDSANRIERVEAD